MADIYVKSGGGTKNVGDYRGIWTTAGSWAVGDRVIAVNVVSYRVHECTTAGAGDAAEPAWNVTTAGTTTMVAGAVFTTRLPDTWANATVDMTRAVANDAAGDSIYVSQAHSESTAGAVVFNLAGSAASPTRIICGNDSAAPPTTVSTAGVITTTGSNGMTVNGFVYVRGLTFNIGTGASAASMGLSNTDGNVQEYDTCTFDLRNSSTTASISSGPNSSAAVLTRLKNCNVKFLSSSQTIAVSAGTFVWDGGAALSGTITPTTNGLIRVGSRQLPPILVSGVDLSNFSSSLNLCSATYSGRVTFRNCKLPASWAGSLFTGTAYPGFIAEMHNCDSGDTNYRIVVQSYVGTLTSEATVVRTGGANDGTTALSWKLVSTANAEYPLLTFDTPEIVQWNETTGSAITATVEIITDNVTLTDGECWIEVQYLGTSGFPLGSFRSDAAGSSGGTTDGANVLATAANQTTSSETWTTTGLTTPVKQKLSVTFTPQEKGFIHAVVKLAKANATVYVDPEITVT